jgi:hypothetical protein
MITKDYLEKCIEDKTKLWILSDISYAYDVIPNGWCDVPGDIIVCFQGGTSTIRNLYASRDDAYIVFINKLS